VTSDAGEAFIIPRTVLIDGREINQASFRLASLLQGHR
jgi:hypothetical protein